MHIILKNNFLVNCSANPKLLYIKNLKQEYHPDLINSFKQFIIDIFNDSGFYGKNALSNRTNNFSRKNIFTVVNAHHYHLGENATTQTDLQYKNNGNPIKRSFLDLFNQNYTTDYKTSNFIINYTVMNNTVIIYNITKHNSWEDVKYHMILEKEGISYNYCRNCDLIINQNNQCTCKKIEMHAHEVINIGGWYKVAINNESSDEDNNILSTYEEDFLINDKKSLDNIIDLLHQL